LSQPVSRCQQVCAVCRTQTLLLLSFYSTAVDRKQGVTWKPNRLSCIYSARMSNIRTICEKMSTRCPASFNLSSSLSSRINLPLLFTNSCIPQNTSEYCIRHKPFVTSSLSSLTHSIVSQQWHLAAFFHRSVSGVYLLSFPSIPG